jgi:phenylpropionate dioxygenase-like ring-hydroxylating dioxygenase large terminal subunit
MIPNQWYAVLESRELRRGKPMGLTRFGEKLVLWRRNDGAVACLKDACAHRGAALSAGRVAHGCVECPFHGFRYDESGRCTVIPAQGEKNPVPASVRVGAYAAREAFGFIWVFWGDQTRDLPGIPFFEDLDGSFDFATFKDLWPVHYSRAIENQLDVLHLPFVHRTTIGRGNRTLVHGPGTELIDDTMTVWMHNEVDRGQKVLKPEELARDASPVVLIFKFPHVWQNRIGDKVRVTLCFVPVDEMHTLLYMRYYQKQVRLPLLRGLVTWLGKVFSVIILRQDKRVVSTQRPVKSSLKMNEKLVPQDMPIILYRRRRQELLVPEKES